MGQAVYHSSSGRPPYSSSSVAARSELSSSVTPLISCAARIVYIIKIKCEAKVLMGDAGRRRGLSNARVKREARGIGVR